jgi:hemolysin activation/secretion protein
VVTVSISATAQSVPGTVRPGSVERTLRPALSEIPQDRIQIPAPQGFGTPRSAETFTLTVKRIEVDGATALPPEVIAGAYRPLIGQKVPLTKIFEAARAITDLYAKAGYALCFALVPEQQIDPAEGVVRIDVVEGYIGDVRIEGEEGGPLFPDYSKPLLASRPLKTAALERFLLLLNDVPGFTANGVFDRIADAPKGATRLVVRIKKQPVTASLEMDNRGSRAFGPYQLSATFQLHSLLGHGETLLLRGLKALNANQLNAVVGRVAVPLSDDGLTLTLDTTYTDAHPGSAALSALRFASSGWTGAARLTYPLLRGRQQSLWLWAGIAAKSLRSQLLATPFSRDRLSELQAGLTYTARDVQGVTTLDATLTQGLNLFGATTAADPLRSRIGGSGVFTALLLSVARLNSIMDTQWGPIDLYAAALGQLASRGLLSTEQCGYGAAAFGRAYDPNEFLGDDCLLGTAEIRWTPVPAIALAPLDSLQIFVVADAGQVWNVGARGQGDRVQEGGASLGIGVRATLLERINASFEFDQPVGHIVALENNRAGRVFVRLTLEN